MSDERTAAEVEMEGLSTNHVQTAQETMEVSEPGNVEEAPAVAALIQEPTPPTPLPEGSGEVREVYRFREMEELRKARLAQVIYRLGDFRKAVMLVGAEWYEEKLDQKTGIVRYYLCSVERRLEIIDQVSGT